MMDDDLVMVPATLLLERVHLVHDTRYVMHEEDAPEHGESCTPNDYGKGYAESEQVTLLEIPYTSWGDYVGTAADRSNHRVLLDCYGEHLVYLTFGFGGHSLAVRLDREIPESLVDLVDGLMDYPIVDEADWSALEMELESEDWADWGRRDVIRDVEVRIEVLSGEDPRIPEGYEIDPDTVDAVALDRMQFGSLQWEAETATGGYFRGMDDLVEYLVEQIVSEHHEEWDEYARSLMVVPGQLSLV
jgi:hypothetical protein